MTLVMSFYILNEDTLLMDNHLIKGTFSK